MKIKLFLCLGLFAPLGIVSCKKGGSSPVKEPDIYLGGYTDSIYKYATYWKNGAKTVLNQASFINSMVVNGNGIYLAMDDNEGAAYWNNGVLKPLETTYASDAEAIAVQGSTVYIAGSLYSGSVPAYWKNGTPVILGSSGGLNAFALSGNDVYAAGYTSSNTGPTIATYWKNGNAVALPAGPKSGHILAIAVQGNDVYAAGILNVYSATAPEQQAVYWKNNVMVSLPANGASSANAYGIAVNGNDVYVAGDINGYAAYWKNGVATLLSNQLSEAYAITIYNNDVYLGGEVNNTATYWKNGVSASMPLNGATSSVVNTIVVQ